MTRLAHKKILPYFVTKILKKMKRLEAKPLYVMNPLVLQHAKHHEGTNQGREPKETIENS